MKIMTALLVVIALLLLSLHGGQDIGSKVAYYAQFPAAWLMVGVGVFSVIGYSLWRKIKRLTRKVRTACLFAMASSPSLAAAYLPNLSTFFQ